MNPKTIEMTPEQFKAFFNLNVHNVVRVYNGKPGCMCGCKGIYSDTNRSKAIAFNKLMKMERIGVYANNGKKSKPILCIYNVIDSNKRNTTVYFDE